MRIVQLANFWTPTSGGLRVVMEHLAQGYAERGHRVLQIVPGESDRQHLTPWGRRTTVASPSIPGTGYREMDGASRNMSGRTRRASQAGRTYRMVTRLRHAERLIEAFGPDVIEVSDRATLALVAARWRDRSARVVLVAHERLDQILAAGKYRVVAGNAVVRRITDGWNPYCGQFAHAVVVPSAYAAQEWQRVGIAPHIIPWGVDTETFQPAPDAAPERATSPELRLVWVGRMSHEKRPDLAIDALSTLQDLGAPTTLTMVGDGPMLDRLRDACDAAGVSTVTFTGHIGDPRQLAELLSTADVSLSTSSIEAFGLSVLESLACGTPVIACRGGAAGEIVGPAGRVVAPSGSAIAAGVLATHQQPLLRAMARERAVAHGWDASVDAMLDVHAGRRADRRAA